MAMADNQTVPSLESQEIRPEYLLRKLHSFEGQLAATISSFAGSMGFVYFHIIWFGLWIVVNQGFFLPAMQPFDPFPYGLLTMVVSLEAIFLSTFILITQNRQALIETYRDLEEEKAEEEAEEEVEDIQKDLEDIKSAIAFIQQKVISVEKIQTGTNGSGTKPTSQKPPTK